jgi:hypothetical protein
MNDTEINAVAQGIMLYLMKECTETSGALAVILCLTLLFYEKAKIPDVDFTIEEFAQKFSADMIAHWKSRTIATKGTETVQ